MIQNEIPPDADIESLKSQRFYHIWHTRVIFDINPYFIMQYINTFKHQLKESVHQRSHSFVDISPINRDAIYRTRSPDLDISQYNGDIRQTQILV